MFFITVWSVNMLEPVCVLLEEPQPVFHPPPVSGYPPADPSGPPGP